MDSAVQGSGRPGTSPRSATTGNTGVIAAALLVLLVVAPVGFVVAIATVFGVLSQVRRHWWEWALISGALVVVVGLVVQVLSGNLVAFHFGGIVPLVMDGAGIWPYVARTSVLGIPLGILAGSAYVGASEAWTGAHEWHPIEQRRRTVDASKNEARIGALVADPEAAKLCSSPPLGVLRDGDLRNWIEGAFVVPPVGQFPAMALMGESGSGKTVSIERLVTLWARMGRKVFLGDFKGSDPELAERVVAAYKAVRPDAVAALWPAQPLDMWRGTPVEVANRLLQVQDFTEPYYQAVAETAVRLAVMAPDIDGRGPVADSEGFLERLNGEFLKRAYKDSPQETDVASLVRTPNALDGVRLRYSGFFAALAGRLDRGFSFEDVDVAVLTVPTLAQRSDAMAVARMVLTDFGHYCLRRKPRTGEDVTFIVDEFSAVTSAAPMVIDLAERVRDVGGQVVVSAQSYEGLGDDDDQRRRMLGAVSPGGVIVHRMSNPDEVLQLAGTVRAAEHSTQLDHHGATGLGTVKMTHKMRVDPDAVRQAKTGEAWIVTHGHAAHMTVLRSKIEPRIRERARRVVGYAWVQADEDLAAGTRAQRRDWWEIEPKAPLPAIEAASPLDELMPGAPRPPELPPVEPAKVPDPRVILAIAAYVRAAMVTEARRIAARTPGLADPHGYVDRLVTQRDEATEAARAAVSRRRRRR